MKRFLLVAASVLCLLTTAFCSEEIRVENSRPSRLLGTLAYGLAKGVPITDVRGTAEMQLIPEGVRIQADDARSVLIVYGTPDEVSQIRSYVSLLDVHSKEMHVGLIVKSPLDKYENHTETNLRNNLSWETNDAVLGVNVTTTVRANDDGTLTVILKLGPPEKEVRLAVRLKRGQMIDIVADDIVAGKQPKDLPTLETDKKLTLGTRAPNSTIVSLVLRPVEDEPAHRK